MNHEYVDIPSLPQPLQDMHWERQRIAERLRDATIALNLATAAYNGLILDHIKINEEIRREENGN